MPCIKSIDYGFDELLSGEDLRFQLSLRSRLATKLPESLSTAIISPHVVEQTLSKFFAKLELYNGLLGRFARLLRMKEQPVPHV